MDSLEEGKTAFLTVLGDPNLSKYVKEKNGTELRKWWAGFLISAATGCEMLCGEEFLILLLSSIEELANERKGETDGDTTGNI